MGNSCRGKKAKAFFEQNTVYYTNTEFSSGDGYDIDMDQPKSMSIPPNTALKVTKYNKEADYVSNESEFPMCLSFALSPYNTPLDKQHNNPVIAFSIVEPNSW